MHCNLPCQQAWRRGRRVLPDVDIAMHCRGSPAGRPVVIGLDTNVHVRHLAQDDPKQSVVATRFIEALTSRSPGFVSHIVLAETLWVLESCYQADATMIDRVVEMLLRTDSIRVDAPETVWRALRQFRNDRGDFSDILINAIARDAGCDAVCTFDQNAAKRLGMMLLK